MSRCQRRQHAAACAAARFRPETRRHETCKRVARIGLAENSSRGSSRPTLSRRNAPAAFAVGASGDTTCRRTRGRTFFEKARTHACTRRSAAICMPTVQRLQYGRQMLHRFPSSAISTAGTSAQPPRAARRPFRHLGRRGSRRRARPGVQVQDPQPVRECGARQGRPVRVLAEVPPRTGSRVWTLDYEWGDEAWMAERARRNALDAPCVDLRSASRLVAARRRSAALLGYREIAQPLADYVPRAWASRTSSSCRSPSIRSTARGATRRPATSRRPRATARRRTSCTSSTCCTGAASA